mmetsp:Transcript_2477/g.2764  ORF Transcript_2477/g.2764 Transcript_2477/m.2764 type:complete len:252 (-) Transcript_2477:2-757(-)
MASSRVVPAQTEFVCDIGDCRSRFPTNKQFRLHQRHCLKKFEKFHGGGTTQKKKGKKGRRKAASKPVKHRTQKFKPRDIKQLTSQESSDTLDKLSQELKKNHEEFINLPRLEDSDGEDCDNMYTLLNDSSEAIQNNEVGLFQNTRKRSSCIDALQNQSPKKKRKISLISNETFDEVIEEPATDDYAASERSLLTRADTIILVEDDEEKPKRCSKSKKTKKKNPKARLLLSRMDTLPLSFMRDPTVSTEELM